MDSGNHVDDKSTLVQAMAWCCRATSHYLNQCWPRSLTPYGAISHTDMIKKIEEQAQKPVACTMCMTLVIARNLSCLCKHICIHIHLWPLQQLPIIIYSWITYFNVIIIIILRPFLCAANIGFLGKKQYLRFYNFSPPWGVPESITFIILACICYHGTHLCQMYSDSRLGYSAGVLHAWQLLGLVFVSWVSHFSHSFWKTNKGSFNGPTLFQIYTLYSG